METWVAQKLGLLDVACSTCLAGPNEPCRKAMFPHKARYDARDKARSEALINAASGQ